MRALPRNYVLDWTKYSKSSRKNRLDRRLTTVVAEAGRMLRLENGPDAFVMPLATVSIGDAIRFVGIPGEPFTEIGRRIKAESPAAMTLVSCITNGYYGYFPTANAYREGGYEARSSIFGPTVADELVKAASRIG